MISASMSWTAQFQTHGFVDREGLADRYVVGTGSRRPQVVAGSEPRIPISGRANASVRYVMWRGPGARRPHPPQPSLRLFFLNSGKHFSMDRILLSQWMTPTKLGKPAV